MIVSGNLNNANIIESANSDILRVSADFVRENLTMIISDNEAGINMIIEHAISINKNQINVINGHRQRLHSKLEWSILKNK